MALSPPPHIGGWHVGTGDLDAPFWAGLTRRELRIQRCDRCHGWIWAPQWRCGACGSWDLSWPVVEPHGTLHSFTRTWHAVAAEVADALPYVTALVELPGAGCVRLLGVWVDETEPAIGLEVEPAWGTMGQAPNPHALCWTVRGGGA